MMREEQNDDIEGKEIIKSSYLFCIHFKYMIMMIELIHNNN